MRWVRIIFGFPKLVKTIRDRDFRIPALVVVSDADGHFGKMRG